MARRKNCLNICGNQHEVGKTEHIAEFSKQKICLEIMERFNNQGLFPLS